MKLWLTVTTRSPGPTSSTRKANSSAAVPLEAATAWGAPTVAANSVSKAATSGPCITQPERTTRAAASASSAPRSGRTMGTRTGMVDC